jgi:hypothetical protein
MGNPYQDTAIDRAFLAFCHDHGLTVFVRGVDKHGSIVWEAGERRELTRYLMLGATEILVDDGRRMQMDITVGADDGFHFTRRDLVSWELSTQEFMSTRTTVYGSAAPHNGSRQTNTLEQQSALQQRLIDAWKTAQALRSEDLDDTYIVPRNEQWQNTAIR